MIFSTAVTDLIVAVLTNDQKKAEFDSCFVNDMNNLGPNVILSITVGSIK